MLIFLSVPQSIEPDTLLEDGDEVVSIPLVSGG